MVFHILKAKTRKRNALILTDIDKYSLKAQWQAGSSKGMLTCVTTSFHAVMLLLELPTFSLRENRDLDVAASEIVGAS